MLTYWSLLQRTGPRRSLLFVLACFINGIYTVHGSIGAHGTHSGLEVVCTLVRSNAAMLGSCGFLVGSFLFVPEVDNGCPIRTTRVATWLFFASSLLFVLPGLIVLFGPPRNAVASAITEDSSLALGPEPPGETKRRASGSVELTCPNGPF